MLEAKLLRTYVRIILFLSVSVTIELHQKRIYDWLKIVLHVVKFLLQTKLTTKLQSCSIEKMK